MARRDELAADRIQYYVDGRLSERDQAAVAAYLLAHPDIATEVELLRRQSEILRGIGQEILDEPVPERLRAILRKPEAAAVRRRAPSFLHAAAAVLVFCAGSALGWYANNVVQPRLSAEDALLANMTHAYDFYGAGGYPVDFPPDRAEEFTSWIDKSFERDVRPPDLDELGYTYRGGRLIPATGTRLGLFQFERPEDARLTVFFWTTAAPPQQVRALSADDAVAARFWSGDGLNLAVISEKANRDLENAADAIFSFYQQSAGSG